eukprot:11554920-Alexandrium_andersonii.AAC.1
MAAESAMATAFQAEARATEAVEQSNAAARRAAATAAADRAGAARPSARPCKEELEPGDGDGGPRGV